MSEEVMYKHIDLYVNNYSLSLEEDGKKAVKTLFDKAVALNLISKTKEDLFMS